MAFVCASTDDVRAEAEQVFSDTGAEAGFCALAGDTATVGLAAEWKHADRVGPELLGSRDAYRALMNGLTRIDAPYEFLGPQPMLSARLVARRLSDVASNRYGIVSVDDIPVAEVARYAVLARLGVLPSMLYLSTTTGQSRQLQAKGAAKRSGFASDAAQAAAFVTLVEQLAEAGECLLPASLSAPYTLVDALWFATSDDAQLRGNDVLRDALGGASGLPAASLALLMLYAACRHGKWQGKALLRLAASVAGEGAEALRGTGSVSTELYAALQLPEAPQLPKAPQPLKPRERADCRELEVKVRDLQVEVQQLQQAARDCVATVDGVPVVVTEGIDPRMAQREAVIDALRLVLFQPKGSSWRFPIRREGMEAQLAAFDDDPYSTQLASDIRSILLGIEAHEIKIGQSWKEISIDEAKQTLQDAVLLMLAPGTDADYALLLQIATASGGGDMLIDAGEEFKRQFYDDGEGDKRHGQSCTTWSLRLKTSSSRRSCTTTQAMRCSFRRMPPPAKTGGRAAALRRSPTVPHRKRRPASGNSWPSCSSRRAPTTARLRRAEWVRKARSRANGTRRRPRSGRARRPRNGCAIPNSSRHAKRRTRSSTTACVGCGTTQTRPWRSSRWATTRWRV